MPQTRKLVCRKTSKFWHEITVLERLGWELDDWWDEQHHFLWFHWMVHVAWLVKKESK